MELSGEQYCAGGHDWNVGWDTVFDVRYLSSVSVSVALLLLHFMTLLCFLSRSWHLGCDAFSFFAMRSIRQSISASGLIPLVIHTEKATNNDKYLVLLLTTVFGFWDPCVG